MADNTDSAEQSATGETPIETAEPSSTTKSSSSSDAATPAPAVTYLEAELFGDDSDADDAPADTAIPDSIATAADPSDAPADVPAVVAAAEVERSNEMERDLFGDISSDEDESNRDLSETAAPIAAIAPSSDHAALRAKLEAERREEERRAAERNEKQRAAELKADQARRVQKEEAKQEAIKPRAAGSALTRVMPDVPIFTDLKATAVEEQKEAFEPRITLLPLPNVIGIQSIPFDREQYKPEVAQSQMEFKDEFGNARSRVLGVQGSVKLGENVMRWRWKDAAHTQRESNTRLVEWNDGSKSLLVGDEVFEVVERVFTGSQATDHYLFAQTMASQRDDDAMSDIEDDEPPPTDTPLGLSAGVITGSMKFRVTSIHSKTHMKLTHAATAHHKALPKMMRATGEMKNVAKFTQTQREAARLEEQRMARSGRRGDTAARGVKDTALNADFLEQDDDDDEQELEADEEAESSGLASDEPSRPARRSKGRKSNTRRYDDDDKRSNKLAKAKRAQASDDEDEDEEDSKPRSKKSKQKRRKAQSSEEEEEEEEAESSEAEAVSEVEESEEEAPASKKKGSSKAKRKKLEEDSD